MKEAKTMIGKLIDNQETAFIGSIDAEGFPNIKAMLKPRQREGIRTFYFTTNTSSLRVTQFLKDNRFCIYFCDEHLFWGVMMKGIMEVLTDSEYKEMIWREGDTMYYKEGVADPDYCVLRFTASGGRYYSDFKSESFVIE